MSRLALFLLLGLTAAAVRGEDASAAANAGDSSAAAVAVADAGEGGAADEASTALALPEEKPVIPGGGRFTRTVDDKKIEKDWADFENDEWHEDTFEWKRKIASKYQVPFDIDKLVAAGPGGMAKMKETMLASEASSGNTQMAFLTLRDGVAETDEERAKLGARWAALLVTNAVKISYHMIGGNELLITEEQGRIMEIKDFVLTQPEVAKFRWKDTDFYPTPTPTEAPRKAKKGGKKGKAAEGKREL